MRYLCLVYLEVTKLDAIVDEVLDYCAELRARGHYIASDDLHSARMTATVRVRNGELLLNDGPIADTNEQLSGFYLINARDLNDAIRVASHMPPARLGCIEVRPIKEFKPRALPD